MTPTAGVRVRVPAKVNLHLGVGLLRADGFHDLVSVFHAVDLEDEVCASPAEALELTLTGEGAADLPTDGGNLAWRAAELLAATAGVPARARLTIHKSIPVAGGMAGGSADAAAALVACARLWDLDAGPAELAPLAAQLGSDVAFPLLGRTALGTGRGEVLEPVPCAAELHWVFALADFGISAGAAYRELDRLRDAGSVPDPGAGPDRLVQALADGDVERIARHLGNDLEAAAVSLEPGLQDTLDTGRRSPDALAGLVSGSGPTCAFLCPNADAAARLAAELEASGACRVARTARGPVLGAQVL